ncbi:hypothetical protein TPA0910_14660 [Streptomyces hygroscopicus subsp. sporocinereus]|uniref:HTH cro/C1-type domain-containing protein n=1 Tax=Streptomyces hygroscopicus TaxID=1912 RepID=A0ABQ3TUL7_STRHY|nr:hypothetical protein TPA0910_14660 [Streptomyces hygroscopicus]
MLSVNAVRGTARALIRFMRHIIVLTFHPWTDPIRPRKDDASMYDRAALVAAARQAGDRNPSDTARRLKVARNTAWRLWNGRTAPSALVAAAVEQHYGVSAGQLVERAAAWTAS